MTLPREVSNAPLPVRLAAAETALLRCSALVPNLASLARRISQRRHTGSLAPLNAIAFAVAQDLATGRSVRRLLGETAKVRPADFPMFADLVLLALTERVEGDAKSGDHLHLIVELLREVVAPDWREDYWKSVPGDAELRRDPSGFYDLCDDETKAQMHAALAEICGEARLDAAAVATAAVALAADANGGPERHAGFYLLDGGRRKLEQSIRCHVPLGARLTRYARRLAVPLYLGTVAAGTAGLALVVFAALSTVASTVVTSILVATLVIPILSLVLNVVHFGAWTLLCPSRHLPSLRFVDGIPADSKTLIAVPMIVHSTADITAMLKIAEENYVRNTDANLWCALLTDFPDAAEQHRRTDDELLHLLVESVRALNARHTTGSKSRPFLLLHRDREWNGPSAVWMGWERKRGKLVELNQLILGGSARSLRVLEGDAGVLDAIRYVIAIDADTRVPAAAAEQLIAILAHPLNRPVLTRDGAPARGYTVLQPRVESEDRTVTPDGSRVHLRINAYECVQDVQHALFQTAMYCGKGAYDVRAFMASLEGRIPHDAVLSHDHLEGMHGAVGVAANVAFGESNPAHVVAQMRRAHRWTRGDWQLLPWLLPIVPSEAGVWLRSRLSVLDRWRLADNLRQSLVAPATTVSLIMGWLLLPSHALAWTLLVSLTFAHQGILLVVLGLTRAFDHRLDVRLAGRTALRDIAAQASRLSLQFAFVAHQSFVACDAIVRTLCRLFISKQCLLEWTTSAETDRQVASSPWFVWYEFRASLLIAAVLAVLLAVAHADVLPVAAPALCVWLLAPLIAFVRSRPTPRSERQP